MTKNTNITVITVTDKPLYVHYVQENGSMPIFNPWLFSEKKPTIKNEEHKRFLLKKWYKIPASSGFNPAIAIVERYHHEIEFGQIYDEVRAITGITADIKEIRALDKGNISYVTDRVARTTVWYKNTNLHAGFQFRPSYEDDFAFFVLSDMEEIEISDRDLKTLSRRAAREEQKYQALIDKGGIISNLLRPSVEAVADKWGFVMSKDCHRLYLDFSKNKKGLWKLIEATIAKDLQSVGIKLNERDFIKNQTFSWNGKIDLLKGDLEI